MKHMKSIVIKPRIVEIFKVRGQGDLPIFLGLCHRHFEKALPSGSDAKRLTITAPIDLLDIIAPQYLLDHIEELSIVYERKPWVREGVVELK